MYFVVSVYLESYLPGYLTDPILAMPGTFAEYIVVPHAAPLYRNVPRVSDRSWEGRQPTE